MPDPPSKPPEPEMMGPRMVLVGLKAVNVASTSHFLHREAVIGRWSPIGRNVFCSLSLSRTVGMPTATVRVAACFAKPCVYRITDYRVARSVMKRPHTAEETIFLMIDGGPGACTEESAEMDEYTFQCMIGHSRRKMVGVRSLSGTIFTSP